MIPREELLRVRRLASRANPRIKDWASLNERSGRDALGLTLAEGARLVGEGLAAPAGGGFRPAALLVSDAGAARPEAGELFARAGELGLERFSLSDECHAKISGLKGSDGLALVMAIAGEDREPSELWSRPGARWLAAAGVQDPGNAGALARTALAAGVSGCLFLDGVDPASPKFLRGSMGAAFRIPCLAMTGDTFVEAWNRRGVFLIRAESGGDSADFRDIDYQPPVVLLVGGERGIPENLSRLPAKSAHIPLRGGVESLNLAVAAGVILFEAERRWRAGADDAQKGGAQ